MNEDFNTRLWADNAHGFATGIAGLLRQAGVGLARLNAIEFDAPWRHPHSRQADRPSC